MRRVCSRQRQLQLQPNVSELARVLLAHKSLQTDSGPEIIVMSFTYVVYTVLPFELRAAWARSRLDLVLLTADARSAYNIEDAAVL